MGGPYNKVDNTIQSFGIRGATSAAIDRTTDEQLGRNIRRDLLSAESFGGDRPKSEPKKTKLRKSSEEELYSEEKGEEKGEEEVIREEIRRRPNTPRNYGRREGGSQQESPPSPAKFESNLKGNSRSEYSEVRQLMHSTLTLRLNLTQILTNC